MSFASVEEKRKYQWNIVHSRKDEFYADKICAHCGTSKKLILHHVDQSTKIDSWVWDWGKKRREEEIAKCIVLCMSCHTKHHNKERCLNIEGGLGSIKLIIHGNSYAYNVYKCRCSICSKAASKRVMKYKKKKQ